MVPDYATSQNDNCLDPFSMCLSKKPYIGTKINDQYQTVIDAFNEFGLGDKDGAGLGDNSLDIIVPFIVERKFGYYTADSKLEELEENKPNYSFFNIPSPSHNIEDRTTYQTDDVIKNNIINTFSSEINTQAIHLYNKFSVINQYYQSNNSTMILNEIYDDIIKNLQKDLKSLNGDKLKQEKYYSSKYYDLNRYKANTNILINSIFIIAIIFVINVLNNNNVISYGFYINTFLIGCLVLYLILAIGSIKDRQFSNWDKKYFSYVNDISDTV
tara:strand:- start:3047 stop:3859 length:813 start_codon:yes stop_codon:yes gene_type:complete